MPPKRKLLFLFGTRPEVIKLAPVIRKAAQKDHFEPFLLHTGQHRELAEEMLSIFGLKADLDFSVMEPNQDLFSLSAKIIEKLGALFKQHRFDMIVVQGDTTSVFLGALGGYYTKTPVAHVEAGLRTHDKFSPYPEEMNRRLVGSLADLHFPPTEKSRENLLAEGVDEKKILVTGNTVIDALLLALTLPYTPPDSLKPFLNSKKRLILVTTHRRENFGEPHRRVFRAFKKIVEANPDTQILFPVHPNPNVRAEVAALLDRDPRIHLSAPFGYLDFIHVMKHASIILTDSGGVQEEAPTLKKPVLVLRETTERPEGLASGALKLVGTDEEKIIQETNRLLTQQSYYQEMTCNPNPYGDGKASERIVEAIEKSLS